MMMARRVNDGPSWTDGSVGAHGREPDPQTNHADVLAVGDAQTLITYALWLGADGADALAVRAFDEVNPCSHGKLTPAYSPNSSLAALSYASAAATSSTKPPRWVTLPSTLMLAIHRRLGLFQYTPL